MRGLFFLIFTLTGIPLLAQPYQITGNITDESTGEALVGATVVVQGTSNGTYAGAEGRYQLTIPEGGTITLKASYFGYDTLSRTITVDSDQEADFQLAATAQELDAIEFTSDEGAENVEDTKVSTIKIDVEEMKKLPALLGEVDIIKNIQMLPGVQVAGEANTGLYVRGGGADQNLVLLDNATIYYPAHVTGIFSVFNADALESAELYKGGIPSPYGGRLSSLLDIRTRPGNFEEFHANGGIGLLASRAAVEGPIVKDKASFLLTGRRTYFDLFLKLSQEEDLRNTGLHFYDLNGRVDLDLGARDQLTLSGYYGKDVLKLNDLLRLEYGNATASANWRHLFNEDVFSNISLTWSDFDYGFDLELGQQELLINNGVQEFTFKPEVNWLISKRSELILGVEASLKNFFPGEIKPGENSIFKPFEVPAYHSIEEAIFASHSYDITPRLAVEYGLRFSIFHNIGEGTVYSYEGERLESNITDTTTYDNFDIIETFTGLEPRLSARYKLTDNSSFKMSYNRMYQYLHLMSNSTSPVPDNIWIPSTPNIAPERADQIAGGYFHNFDNNKYESSVELYYKHMDNVIDFVDNASVRFNETIETEVRSGISWAYGAEFFLRKQKGDVTGWISYTWSKTMRQIDGINNGEAYPAIYDRRHNLNIVGSWEINDRWSLGGTFVYGSGKPYTLPAGKYHYGNNTVSVYTERNGYRLAPYHRMDLSVTLRSKNIPERDWSTSWVFSVYNVYGRKNYYTVMVRDREYETPDGETVVVEGEKELAMYYLFRWLPSVTFNFEF